MENAQSLIQLYRMGFYICLALTVISLVSAVFMFFKFNIPTVFLVRTGRHQKTLVKKKQEENARTGTLRQDIDMDFQTTPLSVTAETNRTTTLKTGGASRKLTTGGLAAQVPAGFKFTITENEMVVHTNEILDV